MAKSEQLQIRVTRAQKLALSRRAREAGQSVSTYVLARALPLADLRFRELLPALAAPSERRHALAALNDLLTSLLPSELAAALGSVDVSDLRAETQNIVAAMVEQAAAMKHTAPPAWVRDVEPLASPRFATDLRSARLHLLRSAPIAFRRRNVFVDSTLGDRA